tara:strand:- start:16 stop:768 length:753 start_codon:yes stop_codon:yes gene_type:complete
MNFHELIDEAEKSYQTNTDFSAFRDDDFYWFIREGGELEFANLKYAFDYDSSFFSQLISVKKSFFGYSNKQDYRLIDRDDSRDILNSTFIFSDNKSHKNIVEIGSAWGNVYRLVHDLVEHEKWISIDLPCVLDLQKWYLGNEISNIDKLDFQSAHNYNVPDNIDLVIATHSLSQVTDESFDLYYDKILSKAKYIFYATNPWYMGTMPHTFLAEAILTDREKQIEKQFDVIKNYDIKRITTKMYRNKNDAI